MKEIFVTDADDSHIAANQVAVRQAVANQRRKESLQSVITGLIGFFCVLGILAVIALLPVSNEVPAIVSYNAPAEEDDPKIEMKELAQNAKPKPPGASASMARVIASTETAPVSVPIPEMPSPDSLFGLEESFGTGFGTGDGDGDGGGGATFFGGRRTGKNVVYIVDFSGSMNDSVEKGGTRISALKKELTRSINALSNGMSVSIVFFSTGGWSLASKKEDIGINGWNGLLKTPPVPWYPVNDNTKSIITKQIATMPIDGGTNWYPPLMMALHGTSPQPNIVYLLSDGLGRDAGMVISDMKEINPRGIPIDTIAFETPGSAAARLMDVAEATGGRFSMVYEGRLLRGSLAEKYTSSHYDDE